MYERCVDSLNFPSLDVALLGSSAATPSTTCVALEDNHYSQAPLEMESQTSSVTHATSFFTRTKKKLQPMYYQYSINLPLYGMQPTERAILNSLVILSISTSIQSAFYVARLAVRLFWALASRVGGVWVWGN